MAGAVVKEEVDEPITLEEAIKIIQIHERARQGRLRAKFMQDIRSEKHAWIHIHGLTVCRLQEERERKRKNMPLSTLSQDDAATIIQSVVRRFLARHDLVGIAQPH